MKAILKKISTIPLILILFFCTLNVAAALNVTSANEEHRLNTETENSNIDIVIAVSQYDGRLRIRGFGDIGHGRKIAQSLKKRYPDYNMAVVVEYYSSHPDFSSEEIDTMYNMLSDLNIPIFIYDAACLELAYCNINQKSLIEDIISNAKVIVNGPAKHLDIYEHIDDPISEKIIDVHEYEKVMLWPEQIHSSQYNGGIYLENHEPDKDWDQDPKLHKFLSEKIGGFAAMQEPPIFLAYSYSVEPTIAFVHLATFYEKEYDRDMVIFGRFNRIVTIMDHLKRIMSTTDFCKNREHHNFIYVNLSKDHEEPIGLCGTDDPHHPDSKNDKPIKNVYLADPFPIMNNGNMNALYSLSIRVLTGGDISLSAALSNNKAPLIDIKQKNMGDYFSLMEIYKGCISPSKMEYIGSEIEYFDKFKNLTDIMNHGFYDSPMNSAAYDDNNYAFLLPDTYDKEFINFLKKNYALEDKLAIKVFHRLKEFD